MGFDVVEFECCTVEECGTVVGCRTGTALGLIELAQQRLADFVATVKAVCNLLRENDAVGLYIGVVKGDAMACEQ